jgi:putative transposase
MKLPTSVLRLKGFRFSREIIAYAVWTYHRFAMSTADVEDLLAERGVIVSREAIRLWVNRFGPDFGLCCANQLTNGSPLSPDGFTPRLS